MEKSLSFSQLIDESKIVNGQGVLSICDIGQMKEDGGFECINQRDWAVPKFKDTTEGLLCAAFNCESDCDHCIVTRILEEKNGN